MVARHAPSSCTGALLLNIALLAGAQNNHPSCSDWAAAGECENNPGYMLTNCKDACDLQTMEVAASFYELSAETASGGTLDFETLRDKVLLSAQIKSRGAPASIITSTPSTRRLLDGVAVPHCSTEPARPRRREMTQ